MPQIVNTNMSSLNAQNKLNQSQKAQMTAMERLSSGLRINNAKDDAAGSAIVSRITSQVEGLQQASRNAVDATNLSKVAEGGLNDLSKVLGRVRQLAVQSATGSYTDSDRKTMAAESKLMLEELNRLSSSVNFNGTKLFDGSFNAKFQVGANAGDTIGLTVGRLDSKTLGSSQAAALNSVAKSGATVPAMTSNDLVINGVAIGASSATSDTASSTLKDASAIAKAAAINAKTAQTGVTATVNANEVGGSAMTAAVGTGGIVLNGVSIGLATSTDAAASRKAVVEAINAKSGQTGVTAEDTGLDTGGVKLIAADGRNITLGAFTGSVTAASTGLAAASTTYAGTFTLQSDKAISVAGGAAGNLSNVGLSAGTYQAQMASVAGTASTAGLSNSGYVYASGARSAGTTSNRIITAGDFAINGTLIGTSLAASDTASFNGKESSAISRAAAINAISAKTGVTATVSANEVAGTTMGATGAAVTGGLIINGVTTGSIVTTTDAAASRAAVVAEINKISAQTGVTAIDDNSKGVKLVAADGRNITVVQGSGGNLTGAATGLNAVINSAAVAAPTQEEIDKGTFTGGFTLSSASAFTITKGNNATADLSQSLGMGIGTYGAGRDGMSLDQIDLSTQDGASKALKAIDNALASIQKAQSEQGAFQNRMESVMSSLSTNQLNLTSTKSGMEDADFAAETAALSRAQVLQQAGVAMLAQANQAPQNVLSLLR